MTKNFRPFTPEGNVLHQNSNYIMATPVTSGGAFQKGL